MAAATGIPCVRRGHDMFSRLPSAAVSPGRPLPGRRTWGAVAPRTSTLPPRLCPDSSSRGLPLSPITALSGDIRPRGHEPTDSGSDPVSP